MLQHIIMHVEAILNKMIYTENGINMTVNCKCDDLVNGIILVQLKIELSTRKK